MWLVIGVIVTGTAWVLMMAAVWGLLIERDGKRNPRGEADHH